MEQIKNDVLTIIKDELAVDISGYTKDKNILSVNKGIDAKGMVYLVLLLEKKYGIKFTEEDFDTERFYTLDGICDITASKLHM